MKPIKMASLALICTLALGVYSAKAQPTGDYLKLNVSLTLQQQTLLGTNKNGDGKTFISTIGKSKLGNKDLLGLLAEMFDTNWPAGAQLEYEIGMGMVVADKTGTNVLFYCEDGVSNVNRYAYAIIDWYNESGPLSGKMVEGIPGSTKFISNHRGIIEIYYDNSGDASVYTDMNGDGLNIENYSEKETTTTDTRHWKENFTPFGIGSFGNINTIITGKITANGKVTSSVH
jgi:hypothetical protein